MVADSPPPPPHCPTSPYPLLATRPPFTMLYLREATPYTDVILQSGGDAPAEFPAHRCILSASSPFFKVMFSLPQKDEQSIQVIPFPERPEIIDALLHFIYPVPDPPVHSLDDLVGVLAAAVKYEFAAAIASLQKLLVSPCYLRSDPTRVYAIACRFDLDEEAKIASQATLDIELLDGPLSDDLKYISAYSYHQLLDLHRRRGQAAQELLKIPDQVKCMQCNGNSFSVYGLPKWWHEFERRAKEELKVRPTTAVIFSMKFLNDAANAGGCVRCPGSVLNAHKFLADLKDRIDALPATI